MSILSIATALLLSTAACSNSASIDDTLVQPIRVARQSPQVA